MKFEVAVLGSPSLIVLMVSVDVKQHRTNHEPSELRSCVKRRGGRPGLPVPYSPDGLCGRKATLNSPVAPARDRTRHLSIIKQVL